MNGVSGRTACLHPEVVTSSASASGPRRHLRKVSITTESTAVAPTSSMGYEMNISTKRQGHRGGRGGEKREGEGGVHLRVPRRGSTVGCGAGHRRRQRSSAEAGPSHGQPPRVRRRVEGALPPPHTPIIAQKASSWLLTAAVIPLALPKCATAGAGPTWIRRSRFGTQTKTASPSVPLRSRQREEASGG